MRGNYSTGMETVDKIGQINFSGNVIPVRWFREILRDNGKPYLLAICILSELCFWYRPKEIRDERSGFVTGYKKRFRGDYLQKDYRQLGEFFGESKNSVKAAMDKLEKLGLVRRIWRNEKVKGLQFTNVLYIDLNPDRIQEISFVNNSENESGNSDMDDDKADDDDLPIDSMTEGNGGKTFTRIGQKLKPEEGKMPASPVNMHVQKFLGRVPGNDWGGQKFPGRVPGNDWGGQKFLGTYTETTKDLDYTDISSYPVLSKKKTDGIDQRRVTSGDIEFVREVIREKVGYSALASDSRFIKDNLDELIELMVEVYVTEADVKISGTVIPYQLFRKRLDSYDQFVMEYVLRSLRENHTRVGNMKKYLLATLYNAPTTQMNRVYSDLQEDE